MTEFSPARRRAVFWAAAWGYILSQFFRSFLTIIVDDLARDLGIGPKEFGALGAVWFFAFAIMQLPVGILLDRYGPRRTVAGMMGAAGLGALVFAQAETVLVAKVGMALIGFGCSPVLMGALYFFARTETPARFAAISSVFLGIGLLGGLLAASPLAALVELIGWRLALSIMAGLAFVGVVLIAIVLRDPPHIEQETSTGGFVAALLALARIPGMIPILLFSIVITAEVWTQRALWVGPFFAEVFGLDPIARGHVALAMGIAMTISAVLAGPLSERLSDPKRVVLVANTAAACAFLVLGMMPGVSLGLSVVLFCLIGLFGATYGVMMGHARTFMPPSLIGRGITLVNFLSMGGTGLLQFGSGVLVAEMKAQGASASVVYGTLSLGFGALMILGTCIYALAPSRHSG
ncbi:AraJ Arabinose efflux permease [Rhabdaerophilaceae bacterium]